MPAKPPSPLDRRPTYGFERFDDWMQRLERLLDPDTFAAVVTTLEEDGRQVDMKGLTGRYDLQRGALRLVPLLVGFGDVGQRVHAFASVQIAEITARANASAKGVTTYVCATRRAGQVDYWWADDHDGFGALGIREHPLSLIEAITVVAEIIAAQAAYDVVDGGDRSGYLLRGESSVSIRSAVYPQLGRWDRRPRRRVRRRTR